MPAALPRRTTRNAPVMLLAAVLPLACAHSAVDLRSTADLQGDYDDVLNRWTRSVETYDGLKSAVFVSATLFGPEMTEAWLREQARLFRLDELAAAETRASLEAEANGSHRLLLAVFTNETRWNDLERPNPAFRVWLGTDLGPRVAPSSIERVRDRNETIRALFPHLGPFRQGYVVRFPREASAGVPTIPPGATRITLEVTGPHGNAALEWEVARTR